MPSPPGLLGPPCTSDLACPLRCVHAQVPFSASNYLLGLTPVQVPAFVIGTVAGMSVWSVLYSSLGGASRKLLDNGADIGSLLAGGRGH